MLARGPDLLQISPVSDCGCLSQSRVQESRRTVSPPYSRGTAGVRLWLVTIPPCPRVPSPESHSLVLSHDHCELTGSEGRAVLGGGAETAPELLQTSDCTDTHSLSVTKLLSLQLSTITFIRDSVLLTEQDNITPVTVQQCSDMSRQ